MGGLITEQGRLRQEYSICVCITERGLSSPSCSYPTFQLARAYAPHLSCSGMAPGCTWMRHMPAAPPSAPRSERSTSRVWSGPTRTASIHTRWDKQ